VTEAWHWFTWSDHGVIDATAFFTLALVVVGSIQLGLFLWQLRLIRKSLIDAQESADAAAKAAEAATRQARVAEDSLTKLERPYLFVFNLSPLEVDEIEDPEDAELEEVELTRGQGRALSGHRTDRADGGYAKATMKRTLPATRKRHAHRFRTRMLSTTRPLRKGLIVFSYPL
jgi:hypothetical protein